MSNSSETLKTLSEAAETTRHTVQWIRKQILCGNITAYQPGGERGRYLIPKSEIDRIMRPVEGKK